MAQTIQPLAETATEAPSTPGARTAESGRLTTWQKLGYGVGGISSGIKSRAISVYVMPFYAIIIGVDPFWAGMAIGVSRVWDMITDPLIGHWSDAVRHPEGRRRIFLKRVAIPYALIAFLFWAPPPLAHQWQMVLYLGMGYLLLYTTSTVFTVPYYALGAELSEHYDERTSVAGYRHLFLEVGAMLGVLLPAFLIYGQKDVAIGGIDRRTAWVGMGVIFGALMFIAAYVPYRATAEPHARSAHQPPLMDSLRAAMRTKPFLYLAVANFIMNYGWTIVGGLVLIVVTYGLKQEAHFRYFMLTQIVCALVSVPLWLRLSAATSKLFAYRVTQIMQAVIFIGAYWMRPDTLWATYLLFITAGASMAGAGITSTALIADISDLDELETGHRREGMFYAALWFLTKLPGALGIMSVGMILSWAEFDKALDVQSAWTLETLRFTFGLFVALTQGVGAYIVALIPLTRENHAAIREQLEARRAAAGA